MSGPGRTNGSGAYLGGIGTMLTLTKVCSSCGQIHPDWQFSARGRSARECPEVVLGTFPVMMHSHQEHAEYPILGQPGLETLPALVDSDSVALPARTPSRRLASSGIPWLMPLETEDHL